MSNVSNACRCATALATILTATGSAHAGNVLVVAAAGGGDFASIQPAVDAAVDGDTLLVKTGTYAGFTVDGKGLAIVEDSGATVEVSSTITIRNVPAASTFTLVGFRVRFSAASIANGTLALWADDDAGALRFYDCALTGQDALDMPPPCDQNGGRTGGIGTYIDSCPNVVFSSCTSVGGTGGDYHCNTLAKGGGIGGTGMYLTGSTVAAYDSSMRGGDGGDGGVFPLFGGAGLWKAVGAGAVFVSDCTLQGGRGGDIDTCDGIQAGDGGNGLTADPAQLLDCSTIAGAAGTVNACGGSGAVPGEDGHATQGAVFPYSVSYLRFHAPSPVREGSSVQMLFTGTPGDRVYVLSSDETIFQNVPSWRGFQLVPSSPSVTRVRKIGVIPPSGTLLRTLHIESLPPGVEASTRYLQAYRIDASGVTLGSFAPVVVLDSAF